LALVTPTLFKPVTELGERQLEAPPDRAAEPTLERGPAELLAVFLDDEPARDQRGRNSSTGDRRRPFTKGLIDAYPGQIEYVVGYYTGGIGRSIMNAAHSFENWYDGIPVPSRRRPSRGSS
jgi:hypothetical protein